MLESGAEEPKHLVPERWRIAADSESGEQTDVSLTLPVEASSGRALLFASDTRMDSILKIPGDAQLVSPLSQPFQE